MLTLRALLSVKPFLPKKLWKKIISKFWNKFWYKEQLRNEGDLDAKLPPIENSERVVLIEQIVETYPFSSILEVGCGYGINLALLAKLFKKVSFEGLDACSESIEEAKYILNVSRLTNAKVHLKDIDHLKELETDSFDYLISCAFLLYIPDNRIYNVIESMLRVAKKGILILEQHVEEDSFYSGEKRDLGRLMEGNQDFSDYWIRDYRLLFRNFEKESNIVVKKIENPLWTTESWKSYAHFIQVSKS